MKKILLTLMVVLSSAAGWAQTSALDMDSLMSDWRAKVHDIDARKSEIYKGNTDVTYSESLHGGTEKDFIYKSVTQYKADRDLAIEKDSLTQATIATLKAHSDAIKSDPLRKAERKQASMHIRELKAALKINTKAIKGVDKLIEMLMKQYCAL